MSGSRAVNQVHTWLPDQRIAKEAREHGHVPGGIRGSEKYRAELAAYSVQRVEYDAGVIGIG
jgi:hypothetical protein